MKKYTLFALLVLIIGCFYSCINNVKTINANVRPLRDTIGFAQYGWQMDSIMARIGGEGEMNSDSRPWKMALCPHDDYAYVGGMYPKLLKNIKAPNIILIGVAHKAAQLGIEDSLVFDSYNYWSGPWKDVPVSSLRDDLFGILENKFAVIDDSLHKIEHSLEALIPFLQYYNRDVSVVTILVPAMSLSRMQDCGKALAEAISQVAAAKQWEWGSDYAIVVTTDAVHYGNEDWGGADRAEFGCDDEGNSKARRLDYEIIKNCLLGDINMDKIRLFNEYTLKPDDYREYKWTWCGRYSVPVALYTAYYLKNADEVSGTLSDYSTSITREHIQVEDIGMGYTAIATYCHWVGYAAVGYR